jgi:hypothetical protein
VWRRSVRAIGVLLFGYSAVAWQAGAQTAPGELTQQIANLAALDYQVRMHAARLIRRTPGAEAVPPLAEAVRRHSSEFVRHRALVLLTAFNDPGTRSLMIEMMADPNDRVREAVYEWLEQHPDGRVADRLMAQLQTEQAEFVRPALVAALAAHGADRSVHRPLIVEASRGLDFFRSAVIEALGRHRAAYALDAIAGVARIEGPLQDDAVLAIGRIGGPDAGALLDELTEITPEAAVMMRGARCLLGERCAEQIEALVAVASAGSRPGDVRAAIEALSAVAQARNEDALTALTRMATAGSAARRGTPGGGERIAVAWASIALRQPEWTVTWLESRDDAARESAIALLKDGFDSVEEDYAEEQFFASVRAGYWRADEGSSGRTLRAALIQRLEF